MGWLLSVVSGLDSSVSVPIVEMHLVPTCSNSMGVGGVGVSKPTKVVRAVEG